MTLCEYGLMCLGTLHDGREHPITPGTERTVPKAVMQQYDYATGSMAVYAAGGLITAHTTRFSQTDGRGRQGDQSVLAMILTPRAKEGPIIDSRLFGMSCGPIFLDQPDAMYALRLLTR